MHSIRIDPFSTVIATILPRSVGENITAGKVAKAALASLVGIGNFCLFPWQMAAPLTLVTTYLVYKIGTMFTGTARVIRRELPQWDFVASARRRAHTSGIVTPQFAIQSRLVPPLSLPQSDPINLYRGEALEEHGVIGRGHVGMHQLPFTQTLNRVEHEVVGRGRTSAERRLIPVNPNAALRPDVVNHEPVGRGHTA